MTAEKHDHFRTHVQPAINPSFPLSTLHYLPTFPIHSMSSSPYAASHEHSEHVSSLAQGVELPTAASIFQSFAEIAPEKIDALIEKVAAVGQMVQHVEKKLVLGLASIAEKFSANQGALENLALMMVKLQQAQGKLEAMGSAGLNLAEALEPISPDLAAKRGPGYDAEF